MAHEDFDHFLQQACPPLGLEWRRYRRRAPRVRVAERMRELGLASYEAYLTRLREDPAEGEALANLMHVTITRFFREAERWQGLRERVLPELAMRLGPGEPLRAWSAGACGGEEPFSLVLTWREVAGEAPIDVVATDIDAPSFARAARGVYNAGALREVPRELRARAFREVPGGWELDPAVRRPVRFRRHDLLHDPPPTGMHLVLCSYLAFTYFTGTRQEDVLQRLARAVVPGGALLIGKKESLPPAAQGLFAPWPGAPCAHVRLGA